MHELCSCLHFYFNQFSLYLDTVVYLIISWDILRHTCTYFFCVYLKMLLPMEMVICWCLRESKVRDRAHSHFFSTGGYFFPCVQAKLQEALTIQLELVYERLSMSTGNSCVLRLSALWLTCHPYGYTVLAVLLLWGRRYFFKALC